MEAKHLIAMVAIIAIAVIETAALMTGTDGQYLSACVGVIAGIFGAVTGLIIKTKEAD